MPSKSERTGGYSIYPQNVGEITRILLKWGKKNYQNFPWRETKEPWHGLIAEILLQRTRANNVIPVFNDFIKIYPSPNDLANASVDEIKKIIFPLGLHWRAHLLQLLGQQLSHLEGKIPEDQIELLQLAGVGPYAAAAYLSFHGSRRGVIIDANIVRFVCRLVGQSMDGETRRKKWLIDLVDNMTPSRTWKAFNYAMLDFTMIICSKKPRCEICPLSHKYCLFFQRNESKG